MTAARCVIRAAPVVVMQRVVVHDGAEAGAFRQRSVSVVRGSLPSATTARMRRGGRRRGEWTGTVRRFVTVGGGDWCSGVACELFHFRYPVCRHILRVQGGCRFSARCAPIGYRGTSALLGPGPHRSRSGATRPRADVPRRDGSRIPSGSENGGISVPPSGSTGPGRRGPESAHSAWAERMPPSTDGLVGEGGLEPPRPFGHRNLNPARLPIPPLARVTAQG